MDIKNNKVVNFVKNNKKQIAIGAGVLVGGITLFAFGKRMMPAGCKVIPKIESNDIKIDDWNLGKLDMCWQEGPWINAIVNNLTVADTGKLGEQLLKIDGVTTDTIVDMVLAVPDNRVN